MPSPLPPIGVPPFTLEGVYSAIAKAFNAAVDALAGKGFVVDVGERVSTVHLAYTGAVEETTGKSTIGLRVIGRMSARDPEAFNRLIDAFKNMLNPIGVRAPSADILAPEPQEGPRFGPPPEEVMVASLNAGPVMTDEEVNLVSGRASFSMKGGPGAGWGGSSFTNEGGIATINSKGEISWSGWGGIPNGGRSLFSSGRDDNAPTAPPQAPPPDAPPGPIGEGEI